MKYVKLIAGLFLWFALADLTALRLGGFPDAATEVRPAWLGWFGLALAVLLGVRAARHWRITPSYRYRKRLAEALRGKPAAGTDGKTL